MNKVFSFWSIIRLHVLKYTHKRVKLLKVFILHLHIVAKDVDIFITTPYGITE